MIEFRFIATKVFYFRVSLTGLGQILEYPILTENQKETINLHRYGKAQLKSRLSILLIKLFHNNNQFYTYSLIYCHSILLKSNYLKL